MADRAATIENLRRQLTKLEVATNIIRRSIQDLENKREIRPVQPQPTVAPTRLVSQVKDRDGNILIESRILFLTKGKYRPLALIEATGDYRYLAADKYESLWFQRFIIGCQTRMYIK